jgi:hypothetical protein
VIASDLELRGSRRFGGARRPSGSNWRSLGSPALTLIACEGGPSPSDQSGRASARPATAFALSSREGCPGEAAQPRRRADRPCEHFESDAWQATYSHSFLSASRIWRSRADPAAESRFPPPVGPLQRFTAVLNWLESSATRSARVRQWTRPLQRIRVHRRCCFRGRGPHLGPTIGMGSDSWCTRRGDGPASQPITVVLNWSARRAGGDAHSVS